MPLLIICTSISNQFNFKCHKQVWQKNKWERSYQSKKRTYIIYISNEDMNIIKTIKSLEKSGILIDGITETVKREIKK